MHPAARQPPHISSWTPSVPSPAARSHPCYAGPVRRFVTGVALTACLGAAVAFADPTPLERLLAKTDKVAKEVAKIRGLPLKKPIPNEVVDKDELRKRL